jgi:histidinol-phosphate aminotransferase
LQQYLDQLHIYPDTNDERLREALVKDFDGHLEADQFIAAAGGSEIIDLTFRAFLREGDEVITSSPCFLPYSMFSKWLGARIVDVPLREPDYSLDVDGILAALTPRTRIVCLTSPNNPTGTYIPRTVLEYLLDRLPPDVLVIYDEVYRHFANADDYATGVEYVNAGYPVLAVNSFSKTYGLAAMRLGYGYTTKEIAAYIRQLCKPFLIPTLSMEAGIAALGDSTFVQKTVALIQEERQFLSAVFERLRLDYTPSQANFFLVQPPGDDQAFVDHLIEYGIMTRPVTNFGAPGKVRISVGTREANEALIQALERL